MLKKESFYIRPYLLLLLGSLLLYANILDNDFVWDDFFLIVHSDALRKWSNIGKFFTVPFWELTWGLHIPYHRPIKALLILFISSIWGVSPFGFHFTSILFFSLLSWLLYLCAVILLKEKKLALLAALFFLVHPIHVEVIASPIAIGNLFSAVCSLSVFLLSINLSRAARPAASLLLLWIIYAAGVMAYDLIYTIPLLIAFWDWLRPLPEQPAKNKKLLALEYAGYFLITLFFIGWRALLFKKLGGSAYLYETDPYVVNVVYAGGLLEKILAPANVLSRYIGNLLLPLSLSPDAYFKALRFSFPALAGTFVFLAVTGLALKTSSRKKILLFTAGWILLGLSPGSHIIPISGIFADRMVFISSMGYALWMVLILESFCSRLRLSGKLFYGLAVLWLGCYAVKTWQQNNVWQNNPVFWLKTSQLSPEKPRVYVELGVSLDLAGHREEALQAFTKALLLAPDYVHARRNLAVCLRKLGRESEAAEIEAKNPAARILQTPPELFS